MKKKKESNASCWATVHGGLLALVFFNWEHTQETRRTKKRTGDRDWTRLEVDFTPSPRDPFLLIKLCVEGTGKAWFDDVELVEVAR